MLVLAKHKQFFIELSKSFLERSFPGIFLLAPNTSDSSIDDFHDKLGVVFGLQPGPLTIILLLLRYYKILTYR